MGFEEDRGTISGTDSQYLDKPLPVYRTYIGRISFYFETFWVVSRCFKHRVYNQRGSTQNVWENTICFCFSEKCCAPPRHIGNGQSN